MPKSQQKQNVTAIIYDKRGRILSIGKNSYIKSHPLQFKHATKTNLEDKIFLHAEIAAIVKCKKIEKAHSIFVCRWHKNGKEANAEPCIVCMSALKETNIQVINYTKSA